MENVQRFHWPIRVYWEDTDAGGVVFYANYLEFFERARTEWLRQLGLHQQALRDQTGGIFVVTQAHLDYLTSAHLDDEIMIVTELHQIGGASLHIEQQAWRMSINEAQTMEQALSLGHENTPSYDKQVLLCKAKIQVAWVQVSTLKVERIPHQILQRLEHQTHKPF